MNEESFENLLEDYLNFEDYSEKYEEDLRNIKETTKAQKRFTFDKNVCITIDEFVNDYLFEDRQEKIDAHNLYHSSLRELTNGTLVGISNEFAYYNPNYINNGYLLVVLDAKNNPGTYINPICLRQYFELLSAKKTIDKKWDRKSILHDINKIRKAYVELNRALYIYSLHRDFVNTLDQLFEKTNTKKKIIRLTQETR